MTNADTASIQKVAASKMAAVEVVVEAARLTVRTPTMTDFLATRSASTPAGKDPASRPMPLHATTPDKVAAVAPRSRVCMAK
ncbi:Uncharacterised protein [Mycobacteroides abscessus subsp. abscessus]|nr:Uncharacterised protein [Mycobacteroides abscessus subsp. abscessus]